MVQAGPFAAPSEPIVNPRTISREPGADLAIVVEGDKSLFNQYGVMVVNPGKFPHAKADLAQRFADWVVSSAGQAAIASYKIDGEQLFFPNAAP